ncbi:MAG: UDP-glucose 4-epimerase GalE [Methanobacteriaceae archaeon]
MILIVGGAGYIGSHVNKALNIIGYDTIVYDNLSEGHIESVKWGEFIEGDLNDSEKLNKIFTNYDIDTVMHFAAFTGVAESTINPEKYYINNVANTINLLSAMKKGNISNFIFSSTAAVYGNPTNMPISEDHPLNPINPYGNTKLAIEMILSDYAKSFSNNNSNNNGNSSNSYNFNYSSLRYFNASGCDKDCEIGEKHNNETHLIPLILDVAIGKRDSISIFGTDYPTPDGTCIRDYIHVGDLASAHIKAMEYIKTNNTSEVFNLGNGNGFSVSEVINCCKSVTATDINIVEDNRRPGDPAILISDSNKARNMLNWEANNSDIENIVKTAWNWHENSSF